MPRTTFTKFKRWLLLPLIRRCQCLHLARAFGGSLHLRIVQVRTVVLNQQSKTLANAWCRSLSLVLPLGHSQLVTSCTEHCTRCSGSRGGSRTPNRDFRHTYVNSVAACQFAYPGIETSAPIWTVFYQRIRVPLLDIVFLVMVCIGVPSLPCFLALVVVVSRNTTARLNRTS